MKRFLSLFLLAAPLLAQVSLPSNQSRVAGRFVAWNYGGWSLQVYKAPAGTGSQTFSVTTASVQLGDGRQIMPFATNAPLKVGNETVTVSAVGPNCVLSWGAPGYCVLTATFSNKHTTADAVSSGTFGLQEALNDAGASGGGAVTVDSTWASAGGTSGMISAATLPSNTGIEDTRTGAPAAAGVNGVPITPSSVNGILYANQSAGATPAAQLAAAITAACAAGVKVVDARGFGAGNPTISSTVGVGCSDPTKPLDVITDFNTHWAPATTTTDMFLLMPGGSIHNLSVDVTSVAGYSGNAVKLCCTIYGDVPDTSGSPHTRLDGYDFFGSGNTTATALSLVSTGSSDWIEYADFKDISIDGGLYGVYAKASGAGGFVTANTFLNVQTSSGTVHGVTLINSQHNDFVSYQADLGTNTLDYISLQTGANYNVFVNTHLLDMNSPSGSQHTILIDSTSTYNGIYGFLGSGAAGAVLDNHGANYMQDVETGLVWGQIYMVSYSSTGGNLQLAPGGAGDPTAYISNTAVNGTIYLQASDGSGGGDKASYVSATGIHSGTAGTPLGYYVGTTGFVDSAANIYGGGGSNIIYYCSAGVSAGTLCRGNGCSCAAGTWTDTGIRSK